MGTFVLMLMIILFAAFFAYHLIKYRNPYKLIMVIGKKGSGKTTLMVKLSLKYNKRKRPVYCNAPEIPGTYYFTPDQLGQVDFPRNAVILVDEASRYWDNRDFKNFKKYTFEYFRFQRQYKHTVYLFSQSFDVDKKIRDLCDRMYLVTSFCNFLSIARGISKKPTVSHADSNTAGESKLVDDINFEPLWLFWLGTVKLTYIPRYVKYFKSYNPPALPEGNFVYTPYLDNMERGKKWSFSRLWRKSVTDEGAELEEREGEVNDA